MKRVLLAASLAICLTASSFAQQLPRPAGTWSAQTVDHKVLKLDQFKGKFVVLAFLLTTCPHCQKFTGVLSQIQQEYASKGVQVLGATIDQTGTVALADFVQRFSPGFPIGAMENAQLYTFGQYGMQQHTYMPMVYFIDRAGMVQAQFMGSDPFFAEGDPATKLRSTLNRLLAPGATSTAKKAPSAAAKK